MKIRTFITGLLVITAGILLYLFNTGIVNYAYKPILFSWQMLVISIGFICLFSRRKWFLGILLMLGGGFFIIPRLDNEALTSVAQNGWAIFLVVLGIIILYKAFYRKNSFHYHPNYESEYQRKNRKYSQKDENAGGYIDRSYVFGEANEKVDIENFKGGSLNCVFGGMDIDLSDSTLADGINTLEINSVFGGVTIYLPKDWNVEIKQSNVFGKFTDNRPKTGFEANTNNRLILKVNTVFGGGEVRCRNV